MIFGQHYYFIYLFLPMLRLVYPSTSSYEIGNAAGLSINIVGWGMLLGGVGLFFTSRRKG